MEFINSTNINTWLKLNNQNFNKAILRTKCYKWTRWQRDNSIHVFPCVCPVRNKECIFIEIYFEVQKACYLILREQEYTDALEQYYKIRHNKNTVFEWVKHYEPLGKEIQSFKSEIKVCTQVEPYKTAIIHLPVKNFHKLFEFQKIFTEYYYSEDYENY